MPKSTRPIREQPNSAALATRDDLGRVTLQGPPQQQDRSPSASSVCWAGWLPAVSSLLCLLLQELLPPSVPWPQTSPCSWMAGWDLTGYSTSLKGESGTSLSQLPKHKQISTGKSLASPAREMVCRCKPYTGTSERS